MHLYDATKYMAAFHFIGVSDLVMDKSGRFIWTSDMDDTLTKWLRDTYGVDKPNAAAVDWRAAIALFPGAKASQVRKRYKGVLMGARRDSLTEAEAAKLIECVESMGMVWEEIACQFEGRTGLQLKNYYYTAKRRYVRRQQGLKYGGKTACPTIDAYFSSMAAKHPELFAVNAPIETTLEDVVEAARGKRARVE
jgi:hypothetical protein